MDEFGHTGIIGNGFCLDAWGAGPYTITVFGKPYRFEDSDRFGPLWLRKDDKPSEQQPGERSKFWHGYNLWRKQGRRTKADGATCIFDPARPTTYRLIGKMRVIVHEGDEDGEYIRID